MLDLARPVGSPLGPFDERSAVVVIAAGDGGRRVPRFDRSSVEDAFMPAGSSEVRHAALWLIGPDMPGLLRIGSQFVAERGGNIDKDIADKFGEKAVVFMSITARPEDIKRMEQDRDQLKQATGCGIVFQPMNEPTVPAGFREELYGFDIITDDAIGVVAAVTALVDSFQMLIVGHTGERRVLPGPRRQIKGGQKFVVMLPQDFDFAIFNHRLDEVVKKFHGQIVTSLRPVPGLLWWW